MAVRTGDKDIRRKLAPFLMETHEDPGNALIRHEMSIMEYWRRVDVVVFGNELVAYEIKSDADSLSRLAGQAEVYGKVFDRANLVSGSRHIKKATALLPSWWGVIEARCNRGGEITLEVLREPGRNPELDAMAMVRMMWRVELKQELKQRGVRALSRDDKAALCRKLLESISLNSRFREGWPDVASAPPPAVMREFGPDGSGELRTLVHRTLRTRMLEQGVPSLTNVHSP